MLENQVENIFGHTYSAIHFPGMANKGLCLCVCKRARGEGKKSRKNWVLSRVRGRVGGWTGCQRGVKKICFHINISNIPYTDRK